MYPPSAPRPSPWPPAPGSNRTPISRRAKLFFLALAACALAFSLGVAGLFLYFGRDAEYRTLSNVTPGSRTRHYQGSPGECFDSSQFLRKCSHHLARWKIVGETYTGRAPAEGAVTFATGRVVASYCSAYPGSQAIYYINNWTNNSNLNWDAGNHYLVYCFTAVNH